MFNMMTPFDRRNNDLFHYFDDFGRDFFSGKDNSFAPCRTDILDLGDHYELHADMPGFKKEEIHIDLDGDCLTISAEHNEEVTQQQDGSNYVRRERRCGSLSRSFDVSAVDVQNISASYENGDLKLELPKKSAQQPTTQRIEIK